MQPGLQGLADPFIKEPHSPKMAGNLRLLPVVVSVYPCKTKNQTSILGASTQHHILEEMKSIVGILEMKDKFGGMTE